MRISARPPGGSAEVLRSEGFLLSKCRIHFLWLLSITSGQSRTCLRTRKSPDEPQIVLRTSQYGNVLVRRL